MSFTADAELECYVCPDPIRAGESAIKLRSGGQEHVLCPEDMTDADLYGYAKPVDKAVLNGARCTRTGTTHGREPSGSPTSRSYNDKDHLPL